MPCAIIIEDMKEVDFWETKDNRKSYLIKELEEKLSFSYTPSIIFTDPQLKQSLYLRGIDALNQGEISPKYLFEGQRFKHLILQGFIAPSSVRHIDDTLGCGLFAEETLPEDSFIGEYSGIVRENNDHTWISNYLYSYPLLDEIGRNYVIDAHSGSLTRFINHSYAPNLRTTYAFFDGYFHMILLTKSAVKKGTQFTFDYGKSYWYVRSPPKEI